MNIPLLPFRLVSPRFLAATVLPLIAACSAGAMQVSDSANDVSSPNAAVGVDPLRATAAAPSAAPSTDEHAHHTHAGHSPDEPSVADAATGEVVYACPMHPEVTSTKAGEVCPKCNMKLVPKK